MNAQTSQVLILKDATKANSETELVWRAIAREIARDINEVVDILPRFGMTTDQFNLIHPTPAFQAMLAEEIRVWAAANNAPERIKLKYQAMLEASAPEVFAALVGPGSISDKAKLIQTVARIASVGQTDNSQGGGGSNNGVQINISLGPDRKVTFSGQTGQIDNNINRDATTIHYDEGYNDDSSDEDE